MGEMMRGLVRAVSALAPLLPLAFGSPVWAQPKTTVHLKVEGCDNCIFIVHNGRNSDKAWNEVTSTAPVTEGKASFRVRSKITPYLSLEVVHPEGYSSANAVAFVAFGWKKYSTRFPGAKGWYGDICWGKRKGPTATLNIVVTEYLGRFPPNTPKQPFIRARLEKLPQRAEAGVNGTPGCPLFSMKH